MQLPAGSCRRVILTRIAILCAIALSVPIQSSGKKDYLMISSTPSGATVEIDGVAVGRTPYTVEIPGAYLRGSHLVFAKFLRHQIHLRLTLDGYPSKELDLANGPTPLVAANGVNHGYVWFLKTGVFNLTLEKAATSFTGNIQATLTDVLGGRS